MTLASAPSNKAKIAKRVIEVLDYFDDQHREATVMDIVRRYDRPQSSTSELLSSLVELGLLHKNPYSRSYSLTARAALIGVAGQDAIVRDGRLVQLLDRLVAQTGLSVALFGMVGLRSQIVTWRPGTRCHAGVIRGFHGGMQEPLSESAAGWLLLSTVAPQRCEGVLRRLNAEATEGRRFAVPEMTQRLQSCRDSGTVHGPAGFGSRGQLMAMLLPAEATEHAMAVGFVYGGEDRVNPESLRECLDEAVRQLLASEETQPARVEIFPTAA
jgi:DNA-binding IclR family transcriptional regulator